jgi:RNA-binding protein 26
MHLEESNIEHLSQWLSKQLEPLTMADPDTLAEYVIALLKHDKVKEELKEFCHVELHDFLKEHTTPFVKQLFDVLDGA